MGINLLAGGNHNIFQNIAEAGNTEGDPALNLLYDAQMPSSNYTYRAYRNNWVGRPYYPPSIGITSTNGQITVYASWNGSTETVQWQVLAGCKRKKLSVIGSVPKSGFETTATGQPKRSLFPSKSIECESSSYR